MQKIVTNQHNKGKIVLIILMFIIAKRTLFLTRVLRYFCRKVAGEKNVSVQFQGCCWSQSFCIDIKFFQLSNNTQSQLYQTLHSHECCQNKGITFLFASFPFGIYFCGNIESKETKMKEISTFLYSRFMKKDKWLLDALLSKDFSGKEMSFYCSLVLLHSWSYSSLTVTTSFIYQR